MKRTKIFARLLACILIMAVALIPMLAQTVASAQSGVNYADYDLSASGSTSTTELDAEYFAKLFGGSHPFGDIELDYIEDNYSYINVKYEEPTAERFEITALDGIVTVTAEPYVYTSKNQATVTWYPVSARVDGTSVTAAFAEKNGAYVATLGGVEITDDTAVTVEYRIDYEFVIDKDDINAALNITYDEAVRIKAEYVVAKEEYDRKMAEYQEYLDRQANIDEAIAEYEKYLDDLVIYKEALKKYNDYLTAYEAYKVKYAKYEEYLVKLAAYNEYNDYRKNYSKLLNEYNANTVKYREYTAKMSVIKAQLDVFDSGLFDYVKTVNTAEPLERQLYSCIIGDTVNSVLNRKEEIVAAVPKAENAIDDAGRATDALRDILAAYTKLESEEDKYGFYITNYSYIKDNIILLTQTLHDLYRYDIVRTGVHTGVEGSGGKTDKYVIMVSQLILFANAISDEPVLSYAASGKEVITLDKNTTIEYLTGELLPYKKVTKTALQILEGNEYVKDSDNATPLAEGYPQHMDEPVKPVDPSELTPVTKPTLVPKPTEPTRVEEPIAPDEVLDPRLEKMDEPVKPDILANEHNTALVNALDSGDIVKREGISEDYTFTPTVDLNKKVINEENVTVTFYGNDGTTVLSRVISLLYSGVKYTGTAPTKASTPTEDYTFTGWVDADGNSVDLSVVRGDLALYPAYRVTSFAQINFYDTDGATLLYSVRARKESAVAYSGAIPTKTDDTAVYTFDKWVDKAGNDYNLSAVGDSVDLYPHFRATPYVYVRFFGADRTTVLYSAKILSGQSTSYVGKTPTKTDDTAVYTFEKWVDANGNDVSLSAVSASLDLYPQFTHVDYIYVNFYGADRTTVLYTAKILPGQSASYAGKVPTKTDDHALYTFDKWVDSENNDFDLSKVNSTVDLYPHFKVTPYVFVNFYAADHSTVLYTVKILPGQSAFYEGQTPEKADDIAVYKFEKWVDSNGNDFNHLEVNESVDLYPHFKQTLYIYVRFYDTDRTTLLYTDKILPGSSAAYGLDHTPEKESVPEADYVFVGWVNSTGASVNLSSVTSSLDLYPSFADIPYVNVYFYDTDGVTLLHTSRVRPGAQASYTGAAPVKDSTDEVDYIFSRWVDGAGNTVNLDRVNSTVNLYPHFDTVHYVILRFFRLDGTLITESRVLKGSAYTYNSEIPVKESTDTAEYDFAGWVDSDGREYDFTSASYSASFTPVFDTYIVINFCDESGNVLETHRVRPGTEVTYGGTAPEKPEEPEAGYLFTGWKTANGDSFDLTAPTVSADLYPVFSVTSFIVLDFYGTDGTLILRERILKGKAYTYSSELPSIESTDTADYLFIGWKDEKGDMYDLNATAYSASLYPVFETVDYIILNFRDENGALLEKMRVRSGYEVVYSGIIPEKPSEPEAGYLFTGWRDADGNPFSLSAPTVSADLYPVFAVTSYIVLEFYDTDGSLIISERILKGKAYTYLERIPAKESVSDADFEFSHWIDENGADYDLGTTLYSAKLYPAFDSIRCVTVNFYDTDGVTLLETHRVRAGEGVVFAGEEPEKDSVPEADYVFSGWQNSAGASYDVTSVTESVDLYPSFDVIHYVIISFYDTDRVTLIETKRVLLGDSLTFGGIAPTKDSVPEADYEFCGWEDESGSAYDLTCATYTTKLYPTFDVIRYVMIRFYDTDGVTVVDEHRALPYDVVIFGGTQPSKPSVELEDYYFSGWTDGQGGAFSSVISSDVSLNLYPVFDVVKFVKVNFYDTDTVTLLDSQKILLGLAVDFNGKQPEKESIPEADYYFSHWVDQSGIRFDLSSVNESIDLYPAFNAVRFVVVSFYDTDRVTLLETHRVREGAAIELNIDAPTKDSVPEADYVFAGWTDADGKVYDITASSASAQLYPYFNTVRYAIVNFFDTDRVTLIETHRVLLGSGVEYDGTLPVRPEDHDGVYTFSHWADGEGVLADLENVNGSVDLYPEFSITPYLDVTFYDYDRLNVLYSCRVLRGAAVVYTGEIPVRAIDEHGRYSFTHWTDARGAEYDLGSVGESVELYPAFHLTPYVVIMFVDADGVTVLDVKKAFPGESVVYGGEVPIKESVPEADYTFSGAWLDANGERFDLLSLEESATVYPEFTVTPYIIVNFYAFDRTTVLESLRQRPDQRIVYSKDTPVREDTALAVYEFAGWVYADGSEYNFERLSASADLYPSFREIPYVTVTFYDTDGISVLYSVTVLQGEDVIYSAELPMKDATDEFVYEFSHWVLGDGTTYDFSSDATVSVYPEFVAVPYVTVTFFDVDGVTVLDTRVVLLGTEAVFGGQLPTKESDIVFNYEFDGWVDENGEPYDITAVQGTVSLYPTFKGVVKDYDLDTDVDGTGLARFTVDLGDVQLSSIPLEQFLEKAANNRASLCIRTNDITVEFAYSQISAMRKAGVASVSATLREVSNGYNCSLLLRNSEGRALNVTVISGITVDCYDDEKAEIFDVCYVDTDGNSITVSKKVVGSTVSFDARNNVQYTFRIKHDVNVSADVPVGIEVSADRAEEGDVITVTVTDPVPEGTTLVLYYYDADSVKHVIEGDTFVMPDGYVLIGTELVDIIYTVTFISDGKILSQHNYKYGETVLVPRDPVKLNDDIYSYTFIGWSSEITEVTGDAVYEAMFDSELLPEDNRPDITLWEKYPKLFKTLTIIAVAIIAIIISSVIFLFSKGYMSLNWKI